MNEKIKKTIKTSIILWLLVIIVFSIRFIRNTKRKQFYTFSNQTLLNNTVNIYDRELNIIGEISYDNNEEKLITSIDGKEVNGLSIGAKDPYKYLDIHFDNVVMELKKSNNEYYYYSEIDDDVLLIFLLKPFFISGSKLENLSSGGKQRQIFMFVLLDKQKYYADLRYYKKNLQSSFVWEGGTGIKYQCYFIQ